MLRGGLRFVLFPYFQRKHHAANNCTRVYVMQKRIVMVYCLALLGVAGVMALVFLAPWLKSHSSFASNLCYAVFSPLCHQIPSRCFWMAGEPLAVCARCLGVYSGFLLGICLYPILKGFSSLNLPKNKVFIWLSLPIAVDTAGNLFMLWETSDWLRFGFGVVWGSIFPFYLIPGLADILGHKLFARKRDT